MKNDRKKDEKRKSILIGIGQSVNFLIIRASTPLKLNPNFYISWPYQSCNLQKMSFKCCKSIYVWRKVFNFDLLCSTLLLGYPARAYPARLRIEICVVPLALQCFGKLSSMRPWAKEGIVHRQFASLKVDGSNPFLGKDAVWSMKGIADFQYIYPKGMCSFLFVPDSKSKYVKGIFARPGGLSVQSWFWSMLFANYL